MYDKNIIIKFMIVDLLILYEKLLHILLYIYFYYCKDIIGVLQIFIVYLIKLDFEAKMLLVFYCKEEEFGLFWHQVAAYAILWFKMMYLIFSLDDTKEQQYLIKYGIMCRLVWFFKAN